MIEKTVQLEPPGHAARERIRHEVAAFRDEDGALHAVSPVCTHLGCSPEMAAEIKPEPYDPDWKGGYFCPCHKSRFDMAGRVFQGVPAPTNLVVPPHHYENDTTIIIGVDPKGAA